MIESSEKTRNGHILIAVDESEPTFRAVDYVGNLLGGTGTIRITLLTILAPPPEDLFDSPETHAAWIEKHRRRAEEHLARCEKRLHDAGFSNHQVDRKLVPQPCPSIADCILGEQEKLGCGTVVITRRGISRKEEFMFGSTSNRILHQATNCAVWVIESDVSES